MRQIEIIYSPDIVDLKQRVNQNISENNNVTYTG